MKILLFGKNGQIGWELQRTLAPLGEVVALGSDELDLAHTQQIRDVLRRKQPEIIVNAAAYTAVDRAEEESELAMAVNARAPAMMAEQALKQGAALIHYSTDYVFDGTKGAPYVETDAPNPLSQYGKSKLEGEQAIEQVGGNYLILRTSWVYGLRRDNFVMKALRWAGTQKTLRIVSDQVGSPTWSRVLAEITALVLAKGRDDVLGWLQERSGIYHLAGKGAASRFDWAKSILDLDPGNDHHSVEEIRPAQAEEFPTLARRPAYSALSCDRFEEAFGLQIPDWQAALALAMGGD
ncbi:MAG: dTDP-4-dehydrorhamnose reductase [Anaerolineae bacterium]|nr:MAG: dTDP-4-dehydrorhamnose reductase [Anaerolineae bacterium]